MSSIVSRIEDVSVGQAAEFIAALKRAGLSSVKLQRVIEDKETAGAWVEAFPKARPGSISFAKAQEIMGNHVLGEILIFKLGLGSSLGKDLKYDTVPFSEAELEEAWINGKYLVAMPNVSLRALLQLGRRYFMDDYLAMWATTTQEARGGYHLLGPELSYSAGLDFRAQQRLLPPDWQIPYTAELVYFYLAMLSLGYNLDQIPYLLRCRDVVKPAMVGNTSIGVRDRKISLAVASSNFAGPNTMLACSIYRELPES